MRKFYVEDHSQIYGCFRCGEIMGEVKSNDGYRFVCESCGEDSVVTFVNALDILNDLHLQGILTVTDHDDTLEEMFGDNE